MKFQLMLLSEFILTQMTRVWFLSTVDHQMVSELVYPTESFPADHTSPRLDLTVGQHVVIPVVQLFEPFPANLAAVGAVAGVYALVDY